MEEKRNVIREKSYSFALKVIEVYKQLTEEKREFILSKQFLRCGTSVGANVEEAIGGQTTKDFVMKFTIAYKEAREVLYWIRLLTDANYLKKEQSGQLLEDADELCRILVKIITTAKNRHLTQTSK